MSKASAIVFSLHRLARVLGPMGQAKMAGCRRFLDDEGGSAVVDYVLLTAVMTAAGLATEHKVGLRVAQMLQSVADAFPG